MTKADQYFDMHAAPMRIGTVRLKVRDLPTVTAFYERVLGLTRVESGKNRMVLGVGETPLLELVGDPTLQSLDPRQAGLFHTAFLLPNRADLARWVGHVADGRVPMQGASDHIVSEALYLADPEGNGIEVYTDRPAASWQTTSGQVRMATDPLDLRDLLDTAHGTKWSGFPKDGFIGHVHLRVGDTPAADRFYRDVLGFDISTHYPGASFYGSGGYHHQLAGNAWNSSGAGVRPEDMAGLETVEVVVRDPAELDMIGARAETAGIATTPTSGGISLADPWGTQLNLTAQ